jgi:hypothetical protein
MRSEGQMVGIQRSCKSCTSQLCHFQVDLLWLFTVLTLQHSTVRYCTNVNEPQLLCYKCSSAVTLRI